MLWACYILLFNGLFWAHTKQQYFPQQRGIHTYSLYSVTASEPSAVVWHMQFLSLAHIHRCQRLFPSLHHQCLTGDTNWLWVLPLPAHQKTQAANPLLLSFRPQTRFWSKIQEEKKKNKTNKQKQTPHQQLNWHSTFQLGTSQNKQGTEAPKSKGMCKLGKHRTATEGFSLRGKPDTGRETAGSVQDRSDQYSNMIMVRQMSRVLHWPGEIKCKTLLLCGIKMLQTDRISHSERMDRTGQWCSSWIFRARLWTSASAEQQRTTH